MSERTLKVRSYLHWCINSLEMKPTKPEILLKGKWLEKAGFSFGDSVKITHLKNGQLLIEKC